tara:strand:- start:52 stop:1656 length:1605 start_codon:yes stop_codon:yes gene_type:complete
MNKAYKSVAELTKNWTEEDFFNPAHSNILASYIPVSEKAYIDNVVNTVIKRCLIFKDLETNEEVPFNDTMLDDPRTLADRYIIELRHLRGHLNRNEIWAILDKIRLLQGSVGNFVDAPISFYDVQSCYDTAVLNNNKSSAKQWKKLLDDGYKYLPNDGTHKIFLYAVSLLENGYFEGNDAPMFDIWEKQIQVYWIKVSQHIEHWSENYLYNTYGKTPSQAAIRTGIGGEICKYVKNKVRGDELNWIPTKLNGVTKRKLVYNDKVVYQIPNHADEDIFSKWIWFYINDSIGSEDDITNWYIERKFKTGEKKTAKEVIKIINKYNDNSKFSKKIKGYYFWLWLFFNKELENQNLGVEDWSLVVELFNEKFEVDLTNNKKIQTTTNKGNSTENLFRDLLGGMTTGYFNYWFNEYTKQLIRYVKSKTNLIELDSNRDFSQSQWREIIKRDTKEVNGRQVIKVRVNGKFDGKWFDENLKDKNGDMIEYDYRPYTEVVNNRRGYQSDHIKPWIKGGKTIIENGEITTSSYNNWKDKKYEE